MKRKNDMSLLLLCNRACVWLLSLPIRFYRYVISPLLPPSCRFVPTCSDYALEALRTHGVVKGSWLTIRRIMRCHPFSRHKGFDPVPKRAIGKTHE